MRHRIKDKHAIKYASPPAEHEFLSALDDCRRTLDEVEEEWRWLVPTLWDKDARGITERVNVSEKHDPTASMALSKWKERESAVKAFDHLRSAGGTLRLCLEKTIDAQPRYAPSRMRCGTCQGKDKECQVCNGEGFVDMESDSIERVQVDGANRYRRSGVYQEAKRAQEKRREQGHGYGTS